MMAMSLCFELVRKLFMKTVWNCKCGTMYHTQVKCKSGCVSVVGTYEVWTKSSKTSFIKRKQITLNIFTSCPLQSSLPSIIYKCPDVSTTSGSIAASRQLWGCQVPMSHSVGWLECRQIFVLLASFLFYGREKITRGKLRWVWRVGYHRNIFCSKKSWMDRVVCAGVGT
jgi:hypothetical protein